MRYIFILLAGSFGLATISAQGPAVPKAAAQRATAQKLARELPGMPTVRPNPRAGAPFNRLRYDKVVAFDYGEDGYPGLDIIDSKGKLAPDVRQWKALTQQQADALTTYISAPATYGATVAACFEPHMGIVFYDHNRVVAHLSICLSCNRLSAVPDIPATSAKRQRLDAKVTVPAEGFSKQGRKQLNALCQQLRFSYCIDHPSPGFD